MVLLVKRFTRHRTALQLYLAGFYIHFAFFSKVPHKEERFLFVIYPLICFAGAISFCGVLDIAMNLLGVILRKKRAMKGRTILAIIICGIIVALSVSRTVGLRVNYGAPMHLYKDFYNSKQVPTNKAQYVSICVGKEWHRFSSNFFMPNEQFKLSFIRSGFRGLLPQPFATINGTSVIPPNMNHLNQEEPSRYINVTNCDYLVDLDLKDQLEEHYLQNKDQWEVVFNYPFLDVANSHQFYRAFYIPTISEKYTTFGKYVMLRNKRKP